MSDTPVSIPNPDPSAPQPNRARRLRLAARQAKAARNVKLFNLLKAGMPIAEIALQEGLSVRRAREVVQEPPWRGARSIRRTGSVQLQIGRLSDAMMVAHAAMMEGNLQALDRVLRIVGELDRYHGFRARSGPAGRRRDAGACRLGARARPARAGRGGGTFPAKD